MNSGSFINLKPLIPNSLKSAIFLINISKILLVDKILILNTLKCGTFLTLVLLNVIANIDPDQLASSEANSSGSAVCH